MTKFSLLCSALGLGLFALLTHADSPSPTPKDTLPADLVVDKVLLGLPEREVPKDNPLSAERIRLGRQLFFDPILSVDKTVACASCHSPEHGFAGPGERPRGIRGQQTPRKAPSLLNRAYGTSFFWDGRAKSLEEQALRPIEDPSEMGSKMPDVLKRLSEHGEYKTKFEQAFSDGVTSANLGKAIASFERVLLRGDGPVDRFRERGQRSAMTSEQLHGQWLYESKGGCWKCHGGHNFTDELFHNTGVRWGKEPLDLGRFSVTKQETDRGKFKTPSLRGVVLTAPYMHDGSLKTLDDVVDFYNQGGGKNPHLDPLLTPLNLNKEEKQALVAFLKAL
ncbi:MAG TPA: cytochrome c peroxidase [Gemmataceae bacterium]|nr:cytochrome c peroxidase [Gemmataceae bacterium]